MKCKIEIIYYTYIFNKTQVLTLILLVKNSIYITYLPSLNLSL